IRPDFAAAASGPCSGPRQFDVPLGNNTDFSFDNTTSIGCGTFKTHWRQDIDQTGDFSNPTTGDLQADKVSGPGNCKITAVNFDGRTGVTQTAPDSNHPATVDPGGHVHKTLHSDDGRDTDFPFGGTAHVT